MRLWAQILIGSIVLAIGALIHVSVLTIGLDLMIELSSALNQGPGALHNGILILSSFAVVVFGHTIQIWIWAFAFLWIGALKQVENAVYFSLVTTTTLGYGDVTLSAAHRVFGAMSAVSGLLNFGLSTAFLIGLIEGLLSGRI